MESESILLVVNHHHSHFLQKKKEERGVKQTKQQSDQKPDWEVNSVTPGGALVLFF